LILESREYGLTNSHGGAGGSDGDMADGCRGGEKLRENECKRESEVIRENEGISVNEKDGNRAVDGRNGENHHLNDEVRRVVGEILDVCEGTFLNLAAVLALRISEDTIPHKCYGGACVGACA
jgi:hypothetical protein